MRSTAATLTDASEPLEVDATTKLSLYHAGIGDRSTILLRNDENHVCARTAQPPRVPVGQFPQWGAAARAPKLAPIRSGIEKRHDGAGLSLLRKVGITPS